VIRRLRKIVVVATVGLFGLLILMLLASQFEQRIFRSRAESLLSQVQSLELRKTPWPEAQRQLKRWATESTFDDRCNATACSLTITLFEPVYGFAYHRNIFVRLDDYFRWRFKLSYDEGPFVRAEAGLFQAYMLAGGRPARVIAEVGMRSGILWSKGFSVYIETYWHDIPDFAAGKWFEYTLVAETRTVPNFDRPGWDHDDPQLAIHPSYVIDRPGGCEICVLGYVHFTPYADASDIQRLSQLDLSCLTRLLPCRVEKDIMPSAWKQYSAEHPGE
jgi:hypothetical protein